MKTIALSKHLWITRNALEEKWVFDSNLWIDTKLFIDPKLLENSLIAEFTCSREKIFIYFRQLIKIIKWSTNSPQLRRKAIDMLAVPERKWLSIGYWNKSDNWMAIKENVAIDIIKSALEMILVWIEDPELLELLGLFIKWYWPDSMSDLVIHIIYDDLCTYTARISKELWVSTQEFIINEKIYALPKHPFLESQIIFIPTLLLRTLPIATSWEEMDSVISQNETLRNEWNDLIRWVIIDEVRKIEDKNINKTKAINTEKFKKLLELYQASNVNSYNLLTDEKWYYALSPFVENIKADFTHVTWESPKTGDELIKRVRQFLEQFKRAIQDNGWAKLLYHKEERWTVIPSKAHNEDVSQALFYMLADQCCQQYNMMLAWESHAWLWHVDFSFGTWYDKKVIVEIKKWRNWNTVDGFESQLWSYISSENAIYGFYVVIELGWPNEVNNPVKKLKETYPTWKNNLWTSEIFYIDGRIYPSPSKL